MSSLTRIVPWSQQLVCEILQPGDLAVDLTAGKGRDTLALAKAVGSEGQVVAFDLQAEALEQTAELLQSHDFAVHLWPADQTLPQQPGIFLVQTCHSSLDKLLQHPAKAIMANLGYMPGGDQSIVTHPDSTLSALQQSLTLLLPGGRLTVTVYPAHPGGGEEKAAVDAFFCNLPSDQWKVLSLCAANCNEAPYLLVAENNL
ncbi:MAG: hypothetical protein DRH08_02645 [Deltaproteobacteria bacterium]|nr:MAG: hypothetical protein DRH08_02645 [Deltaproteobacteria bacterium]